MRAGGVKRVALASALLVTLLCINACTPVVTDAGCREYGVQRARMPVLGVDDVSAWVAVTDSAMTGACR